MRRLSWPFAFAILLMVFAFRGSSADAPLIEPSPGPLTGKLLVASPAIDDPNFSHTVVLIVNQGTHGHVGIIINRPLAEQPLARVLEAIGQPDDQAKGTVRVFIGGPVEPQLGFIVHSADYRRTGTRPITDRLALTNTPEILHDIGQDRGPKQILVAFGYAGWGRGQLESEMNRGDWYIAVGDPWLIFDADRSNVWILAWARRTIGL